MDRNLHTDDFERLLREKSDEFRMYPSKRIWYSIYNNIHPGRKWPSVAMSIILISALLLTGYLNTNNTYISSTTDATKFSPGYQTENNSFTSFYHPFTEFNSKLLTGNIESLNISKSGNLTTGLLNDNPPIIKIVQSPVISALHQKNGLVAQNLVSGTFVTAGKRYNSNSSENTFAPITLSNKQTGVEAEDEVSLSEFETPGQFFNVEKIKHNAVTENTNTGNFLNAINYSKPVITDEANKKIKAILTKDKNVITKDDKEWIENYASYNRPMPKKWAGKLSWQMYATPSIVYRSLYNDPNFGTTPNSAPFLIAANRDINDEVVNKPSLGIEVGTALQYSILKGIKIKGGLQLNFTRYNSNAFHNTHPVTTKLVMHDYATNSTYELFRTTPYSNKTGLEAVKLHNETYQLSLPVGVDVKLLGNEKLQWNVGVTLQPTLLLGGKSYLISSDRRNYVKENSMLNRWNLNTGIETFISYKLNGFTYQVGPQIRRQLFSTNNKQFAVEERLINYGIKFGIVKTIK